MKTQTENVSLTIRALRVLSIIFAVVFFLGMAEWISEHKSIAFDATGDGDNSTLDSSIINIDGERTNLVRGSSRMSAVNFVESKIAVARRNSALVEKYSASEVSMKSDKALGVIVNHHERGSFLGYFSKDGYAHGIIAIPLNMGGCIYFEGRSVNSILFEKRKKPEEVEGPLGQRVFNCAEESGDGARMEVYRDSVSRKKMFYRVNNLLTDGGFFAKIEEGAKGGVSQNAGATVFVNDSTSCLVNIRETQEGTSEAMLFYSPRK